MLQELLIMALATATVSVTVGQSKLFAPWRMWVKGHWRFLGELMSCPYCLGHWVAAGLVLEFSHRQSITSFANLLVWWLAVTGLSALISGSIGRLYGD